MAILLCRISFTERSRRAHRGEDLAAEGDGAGEEDADEDRMQHTDGGLSLSLRPTEPTPWRTRLGISPAATLHTAHDVYTSLLSFSSF